MSVMLQSDQESLEFRKIALIFAMETICRAGRDTDAENGLVDTQGKESTGRVESSSDVPTLPYVKQIASGKQLYSTENSACGSVTTRWVGWVKGKFKRDGISVYLQEKKSTSAIITVWITTNCGKLFKRLEYETTLPAPEKSVCRSRNNS